jgi:hypothetical protein
MRTLTQALQAANFLVGSEVTKSTTNDDIAAGPARQENSPPAVPPELPADYYDKDNAKKLIKEEQAFIAAHRARDGREDWYGLALSGGGIRSAIFCLGALQALAAKNIMPSFDYTSSVSGGGYISAALHWLWKIDPANGTDKESFPFGASREYRSGDDVKDGRLAYLRTHGQYLIPDERLSIWSLTAVVIRTLFLNLAVWLPVGATAYVLAILPFRLMQHIPGIDRFPNLLSFVMSARWQGSCGPEPVAICKSAADSIAAAAKAANQTPDASNICNSAAALTTKTSAPSCDWPLDIFFDFCLLAGLAYAVYFAGWALLFSFNTKVSAFSSMNARMTAQPNLRRQLFWISVLFGALTLGEICLYVRLGSPELGPFIWVAVSIAPVIAIAAAFLNRLQVQGLSRAGAPKPTASYWWRRTFEIRAGARLPWITILLALGTVPVIPYLFVNKAGFAAKIGTIVLSLVSGLYAAVFGHRAQADQSAPGDLSRWALMLASAIFIYAIAVVAYVIAQLWFAPGVLFDSHNVVRGMIMLWAAIAFVLMFQTNTNYVGLHRFYRDRLMEAFMPDPDAVARNEVDVSPDADNLSLTDLWPPAPAGDGGSRNIPYPIINTNGIFMNDPSRLLAWRGGDNFMLTPMFVGSTATGWERTSKHIARNGPLSLPSAMAASGAAINANAAYVGAGVTRDRLVSIVLMLLNLRLGMWIARPDATPATNTTHQPNHWSPSFRYGLTRTGYTSQSSFVELTDGGHFDNSGIYELARRKCSVIVAIDGEEDPSMALPALYSVSQRVREDFKATIKLDGVLNDLVPEKGKGYPEGVTFVTRPYFVAPITYEDGTPGVLIYVKLSLAQGLGFDALGYRAQHTDFPHQPTADQFFVPEQVEAYRNVGFVNMEKAIDELSLTGRPISTGAVLRAYGNLTTPPRQAPSYWQRPKRIRRKRRTR